MHTHLRHWSWSQGTSIWIPFKNNKTINNDYDYDMKDGCASWRALHASWHTLHGTKLAWV